MRAKIVQPRFDHAPTEGMYFVGPGRPMIVRDEAGTVRECHPGDPIPEAFDFKPNRRRVMLAKHRLRFVSRNALADGVLLQLVEGQTPEARAEMVASLKLPKDAPAQAVASALAAQGMAGLAQALPPGVRPTRVRPKRQEPKPAPKKEATPSATLLPRADYPNAEAYANALVAADGPKVEAALADAGLLGHYVNAARLAEKDAARRVKALDRESFETEAKYQEAEEKARRIVLPPTKALDLILKARRARKKDASATDSGMADLARCVLLEPEAFEFQPKQRKG